MGEGTLSSFGEWLKQRRKARGFTQEELADMVNCSRETVRKYESGERRPPRQMAESLAEALDVAPEDRSAIVQLARIGSGPLPELPIGAPGHEPSHLPVQHAHGELPPSNIPAQRTAFIGREREIEQVAGLLSQPNIRLLTLTGPPGIGKTRLSLQVALSLMEQPQGDALLEGAFLVHLAQVTDPAQVPLAIARSLQLKEAPNQPLIEVLKSYLRDRRLLLVMDNFEQVLPAAQLVTDLMEASPGLKVLVTSATILRLYGEREFPVPPLSLPNLDGQSGGARAAEQTLEQLSQYEAVQLFLHRVLDAKPDFELDNQNALVVARICNQLDGLPLAIELAAARIKVLPPEAILSRLSSRLNLLATGSQDLPTRHRTLRSAIAWSYDLLSESEKAVLRRLSVFLGGATLDAIEVVVGTDAHVAIPGFPSLAAIEPVQGDLLDIVAALVDRSLLKQDETSGEPRFRLLATIREFTQEHLEERSEAQAVRQRHAIYFTELAEAAEPHLTSAGRDPWLEQLEVERYNIQEALTWTQSDSGNKELGLRLAGALHWYWYFRGYYSEGRRWLEKTLEQSGPVRRTAAGAKALDAAGRLALVQEDYAPIRPMLEDSVSIWREMGDKRGLAFALTHLGEAIMVRDREHKAIGASMLEEASSLFQEMGDKWGLAYSFEVLADSWSDEAKSILYYEKSLPLYRELGDKWGIVMGLHSLGLWAMLREDYESARSMLEEVLTLRDAITDKWYTGHTLLSLGQVFWHDRDYAQARNVYDEAFSVFRELGAELYVSVALRCLGHLSIDEEDYEGARSLYRDALALVYKMARKPTIALSLMGLGWLAANQGHGVRAARLFGAAEALREASLGGIPPADLMVLNRALPLVRETLGEAAFKKAWEEGRSIPWEEAVAYAYGDKLWP